MSTTVPALTAPTRVWCDHGARHPWVASHVDEHGWIIDIIGRADTRQDAERMVTTLPPGRFPVNDDRGGTRPHRGPTS